jgi:nuclease S1
MKNSVPSFIRLAMFSVLVGGAQSVLAWGAEGHQLVARIAESLLSNSARAQVNVLLAQEPGATLASISTWADEHRNPTTAPWHYMNFPRGECRYQKERDCPDGRCVVEAIERQEKVLRESKNQQEQLSALKYIVHFVADVHQPLHAGWGDDRGGNSYQLQAFMRGSNLHSFWDTGMIRYFEDGESGWDISLLQEARPSIPSWSPKQAAEESCRIVAQEDFYPPRTVGTEYANRFEGTLRMRLALAGSRLAQLLNAVWP